VAHGLDIWNLALARVHVTRLDGGPGRVEGDVVHHEGFCVEDDVVDVDGLRVLRPERCVLEAGSRASNESALVLFDALLRQTDVDAETLFRRFQTMQHWPFMRHLHIPVRMADGESKSVGESRGRYLFWTAGVPAPILQFEVRNASDVLLGTTDWAWPRHGVLGEFDGRVKYGRLLKEGQEPGDVVFAEKQREELLCRETDMRMVRIVWADYDRPRTTVARLERSLNRAS
jgi:hypothetical protein